MTNNNRLFKQKKCLLMQVFFTKIPFFLLLNRVNLFFLSNYEKMS